MNAREALSAPSAHHGVPLPATAPTFLPFAVEAPRCRSPDVFRARVGLLDGGAFAPAVAPRLDHAPGWPALPAVADFSAPFGSCAGRRARDAGLTHGSAHG